MPRRCSARRQRLAAPRFAGCAPDATACFAARLRGCFGRRSCRRRWRSAGRRPMQPSWPCAEQPWAAHSPRRVARRRRSAGVVSMAGAAGASLVAAAPRPVALVALVGCAAVPVALAALAALRWSPCRGGRGALLLAGRLAGLGRSPHLGCRRRGRRCPLRRRATRRPPPWPDRCPSSAPWLPSCATVMPWPAAARPVWPSTYPQLQGRCCGEPVRSSRPPT